VKHFISSETKKEWVKFGLHFWGVLQYNRLGS